MTRRRDRRRRSVSARQQRCAARTGAQDPRSRRPILAARRGGGAAGSDRDREDGARARRPLPHMMDGGVNRLRRLDRGGRLTEVTLPFDGTIGGVFATHDEDGALLSLTGWLTPERHLVGRCRGPGGRYRHHPQAGHRCDVPTKPGAYSPPRTDGTQIPYSVIYRQGSQARRRAPAWISAYGSYGIIAYTPTFNPRILALIDAGAIVGYANVRGGGEYGRDWHKAGQLANKPNTWRDLIAVCEDFARRRYTSPRHLAIGGRSAGGITVGRALTERPDLFAAVIDGVGWSNPAALRGRTERIRRGAGVGRHRRTRRATARSRPSTATSRSRTARAIPRCF